MFAKPAFAGYELEETFQLPIGTGPNTPTPIFDALPDGRIAATDGATIFLETARASRQFQPLCSAPDGYPAFLRVSPNGTRIAFGATAVTIFDITTPTTQSTFSVSSYDAEWADEQWLVISTPTGVVALDTTKDQNNVVTVLSGRGGASAGVTLDKDGNLYTGNGYSDDEANPGAMKSKTGAIKAFLAADWRATLTGAPSLNFESTGALVADLLSAGYLGFDDDGNLLIGGGNLFGGLHTPGGGDRGYAAMVSATAIQDALRGGVPVVPGFPPSKLHIFDPDKAISHDDFYYIDYNPKAQEFYLNDHDKATVYAFRKVFVKDRILVLDGKYHLGDDPGVFQGVPWVGSALILPMRYEWINDDPVTAPEVKHIRFIFETRDIETWSDWQGHAVLINNTEIGRLKDRGDRKHSGIETHIIAVDKNVFLGLVGPSQMFDLSIVLERQAADPGCADDFLLTRIDALDIAVRAGRK